MTLIPRNSDTRSRSLESKILDAAENVVSDSVCKGMFNDGCFLDLPSVKWYWRHSIRPRLKIGYSAEFDISYHGSRNPIIQTDDSFRWELRISRGAHLFPEQLGPSAMGLGCLRYLNGR